MRHRKEGRKLKRTASHKKALMRNMAMQLFEHKRIHTTEIKAKELRPYAESIITRAKNAIAREAQGLLPEGQKTDVHARRIIARDIHNPEVVRELFDAIAPAVESRNGGYTRIVKTGFRRGDGGAKAFIELVDFSIDADPRFAKKKANAKPESKTKQPEIDTFDNMDAPKVDEPKAVEAQVDKTTTELADTKAEETPKAEAPDEVTEEISAETTDAEATEAESEESAESKDDADAEKK